MQIDAMSAPSKFNLSSGSPDRPMYASARRGSYGASPVDRSGSFRDNMENPLSSLPSMAKCSSFVTQGDVLNFFQCVRIDPKSMVVEHKLNRPADFERLASSATGITLEDSSSAPSKSKQVFSSSTEDLRRLKSGVRESGTKARERVKIFNDCLSVINKCFPNIPVRKRSRLDALSNDRSNVFLSIDRSASGKTTLQNHPNASAFELEQQKTEERPKSIVPSKRTRTSVLDARAEVRMYNTSKPSVTVDKERDAVRVSNGPAAEGEDHTSTIAVGGWENSKMKKKRIGIKVDVATLSIPTKPADGYKEHKQGLPRVPTESRLRLTDAHGLRSSAATGGPISQTSSALRASITKADSDYSFFLQEGRDRPIGQDKERVNLKVANKTNSCEDFSSGSPTDAAKLNANVRAPRTGIVGGVPKIPQVVPLSASSNDWELSNCTNKIPGGFGANSRKRTPSTRSSSPVSNWVPRPPKVSRTARRTKLSPILLGNDTNPVGDTGSDLMLNDRRTPAHSPQQIKMKSDNFSPAALSESEELVSVEIKLRDKSKRCNERDVKSCQIVQKVSTLVLPSKTNKSLTGVDRGSVRRHGRSGRGGIASSRSIMPLSAEKLGTGKQIRSSTLGLDNAERASRLPTRKISDKRAYTRQKHSATSVGADFFVGSHGGQEELVAAANAVTNTSLALSSEFWKKMGPVFRFISDADISYLKDQVNPGSAVNMLAPVPLDAGSCTLVPNGCSSNGFMREEFEDRSMELSPEYGLPVTETPNEISMYQRLIASLIPEEGNHILFENGKDDCRYDSFGSLFEVEKDNETDSVCSGISPSSQPEYPISNGCDVNSYERLFYEPERNTVAASDAWIPSHDCVQNGLRAEELVAATVCSDYQFHNISVDERLALELHRIGIYPDLVSGDEEICWVINKLDEEYQAQVSWKKSLLGKLINPICETEVFQRREFESRALDKLVGIAYEKYMSCWGPNAHVLKGSSGKMAKKATLAFVKWALELYHEFEVTGKSCFNDPFYRDLFLLGVSRQIDGQTLNSSMDNESGKLHYGASGCSGEVRTSAPFGIQQSPNSNNQDYSSEEFLLENLCSEQNFGKENSWLNRGKRRELSLDDLGGAISNPAGIKSVIGGSLSASVKGKRSDRDREGKGNSRAISSRSGTTKISRTASVAVKENRKSKAKPKQKISHLSASVDGSLRMMHDQPKGMLPSTLKSSEINRSDIPKDKEENGMDKLEDPIDLSGLQIPEIDDLGVPDGMGGQGGDIASWFDIEDDGFHEHDYIGGLEIPMDNLDDIL